jgi:nucleoside-diphosphate-sugar epimerase
LEDLRPEVVEEEVKKYTLGSNDCAKEILGWNPTTDMEEGLRKMIDYYK